MKRLAVLAVALLAACHDDPKKTPDAAIAIDAPTGSATDAPGTGSGDVEVALIPAVENRDVDLLFVVDDSPSTLDKQTNLKNAFPTFATTLSALPGGLPNVHIGVVTSDLGTSAAGDAQPGPAIGSGPGGCNGHGKAGNLTTNGAATIQGNFISDTANGGGRTTNYTGTLAEAFSASASVGAAGCGFEQSIEAAKVALGNNPTNAGFLRPSASLAIIFVTDEDDCSLEHTTMLGTDTTTLGPLQSFRCTRFGVTCDVGGTTPDEMNQAGVKGSCHSNDSGQYLAAVGDYVSYFKSLKADPRNVLVAAIAADPQPVTVELRVPPGQSTPVPALAHSCQYTDANNNLEVGDPAVRIQQLVDGFDRHAFGSICSTDLAAPLADVANQLGNMVGNPCIGNPISDVSTCRVFDERPNMTPVEIPSCAMGGSPCYALDVDAAGCPAAQHYKLTVTRQAAPPPDTMVSVVCSP